MAGTFYNTKQAWPNNSGQNVSMDDDYDIKTREVSKSPVIGLAQTQGGSAVKIKRLLKNAYAI